MTATTSTRDSTDPTVEIGKSLPPALMQALDEVTEITSLPEITTKIVQVVEDPRATAHDMHEIVRTDPALATKILRVVNSAFYGLPSQIASLDRAILLLGLSAVKNIALAASLSRMFNVEAVSAQFAARDLWRHGVAVGVCARLLSEAGKAVPADEAFVAGLVHDLGLIAVQQLYPTRLQDVVERCYNEPQDFCALEGDLIGADHQAFGGALASKWGFPPTLRYAIACHHDPNSVPAEYRKCAFLVHLADVLCCQAQYGFWLSGRTDEIDETGLADVGLSPDVLAEIAEALPEGVMEAEQIFA